jgi:hypothetical protein
MIDLERDLPTSPEDVAALRRARLTRSLDLDAYLRFLASLPPSPASILGLKPGPREDRPFSLVD